MKLIPKNWAVFQHYKDRCPPWIKLHRDLLNDRQFICLPLASKALAPLLWLLASEHKDGAFEADIEELEFRLRMKQQDIADGLKGLIEHGFFIDASTMQAPCYQLATPETETERERETETKGEKKQKRERAPAPAVVEIPAPDFGGEELANAWGEFVEHRKTIKAPLTSKAAQLSIRVLLEATIRKQDPVAIINKSIMNGWKGLFLEDRPGRSGVQHRPGNLRLMPQDFDKVDYGETRDL